MNKIEQIEMLRKSTRLGIRNEFLSMIESFKMKDVYEYQLSDDIKNGVYDKLSEREIVDILTEIENELIPTIEFKFISNDTFVPSQWW